MMECTKCQIVYREGKLEKCRLCGSKIEKEQKPAEWRDVKGW